jgi:hypothetical protein
MAEEEALSSSRIRLKNVFATMKGVFAKMWANKNVCFFVGSVLLMHTFGDELAV